ncbi:MAG: nitroreductase family protein [Acidimicrobiia bacterium]
MELREVLDRRRMVRNYEDRPVPVEALERILDAGTRAPSAGNTQGVTLVVVTDAGRRSTIADRAGEGDYVARGFEPWLGRAPVHVVVCTSERAYRERYAEDDKPTADVDAWTVPYWWVDAGAAFQNLLLAAVDEGLAAGFLGAHAIPGLADAVGLPDDVAPLGVVTIGHPAPDRRSGSLDRGRRADAVRRETWEVIG